MPNDRRLARMRDPDLEPDEYEDDEEEENDDDEDEEDEEDPNDEKWHVGGLTRDGQLQHVT